MSDNRNLTHEEIKNIFNETYNNFYLKWRNKISSEKELAKMVEEARELSGKYGHAPLILHITVELVNVLEQEWKNEEEAK